MLNIEKMLRLIDSVNLTCEMYEKEIEAKQNKLNEEFETMESVILEKLFSYFVVMKKCGMRYVYINTGFEDKKSIGIELGLAFRGGCQTIQMVLDFFKQPINTEDYRYRENIKILYNHKDELFENMDKDFSEKIKSYLQQRINKLVIKNNEIENELNK